jgi:FkbM family methyltransferase
MKTHIPEQQLDQLLDEDIAHARIRAATAYDLAASGLGDKIILFGAGGCGRMVLRKLRELKIHPIAFTDNSSSLWGRTVDGLHVFSPQEAASKYARQATFLVCIWGHAAHDRMADRIGQLRMLGCASAVPFGFLFWKYNETTLPYFCLDSPQKVLAQKNAIRAAMQLWSDDFSREEYVAQLGFRVSMDFALVNRAVGGTHYFPPDLISLREDEVFVDCGAFDGDTIADFVQEAAGRFQRVVAFEPDPVTYLKLQERVRSMEPQIHEKIELRREATGRKPELSCIEATGTMMSTVGSGSSVIQVNDLDSALASIDPTYLKFDIEGFEPEALMGASHLLARTRPILALSIYHLQDHLWKIPLLLASLLGGEYQFFLRPHGAEAWDLVCYAIPAERVVRST